MYDESLTFAAVSHLYRLIQIYVCGLYKTAFTRAYRYMPYVVSMQLVVSTYMQKRLCNTSYRFYIKFLLF